MSDNVRKTNGADATPTPQTNQGSGEQPPRSLVTPEQLTRGEKNIEFSVEQETKIYEKRGEMAFSSEKIVDGLICSYCPQPKDWENHINSNEFCNSCRGAVMSNGEHNGVVKNGISINLSRDPIISVDIQRIGGAVERQDAHLLENISDGTINHWC